MKLEMKIKQIDLKKKSDSDEHSVLAEVEHSSTLSTEENTAECSALGTLLAF